MKPELANKPLSFMADPQAAYNLYLEQGYFIEYEVFTAEECARFIEEANSLTNAIEGTYKPQMMPHRTNPHYLTAMKHEKIKFIMDILVQGEACGLQSPFFYCKPGTRGFSLHQDNFFVQAPYGSFASAWTALTDTHEHNGGLIVYPGTHKEGQLPVRKLNLVLDSAQDPNANNEETVVPKQYQPINASVPKGAVLFIHGHIVHGSNPNTSDVWRHVLLNTYIKKGEPFRPGNYAQREIIDLR